LLDCTIGYSFLSAVLLCGVFHVQVPASVCVHKRISVGGLYVVCGVQSIHGGLALWSVCLIMLFANKRNVLHWTVLSTLPSAIHDCDFLV